MLGFTADRWSASHAAAVLGYGQWGVAAAVAVCTGRMRLPDRLARSTGVRFGVAGALAALGLVGFTAGNSALEAGVLASGVVSLSAVVATAILLGRPARKLIDRVG